MIYPICCNVVFLFLFFGCLIHCKTGKCSSGNALVWAQNFFIFCIHIQCISIIISFNCQSNSIADTTYSVISNEGLCGHTKGGQPFRCYMNVTNCEERCNRYRRCIGYSNKNIHCLLVVSSRSCPGGWSERTGKLARSENELQSLGRGSDYNCHAKLGMFIVCNPVILLNFDLR